MSKKSSQGNTTAATKVTNPSETVEAELNENTTPVLGESNADTFSADPGLADQEIPDKEPLDLSTLDSVMLESVLPSSKKKGAPKVPFMAFHADAEAAKILGRLPRGSKTRHVNEAVKQYDKFSKTENLMRELKTIIGLNIGDPETILKEIGKRVDAFFNS